MATKKTKATSLMGKRADFPKTERLETCLEAIQEAILQTSYHIEDAMETAGRYSGAFQSLRRTDGSLSAASSGILEAKQILRGLLRSNSDGRSSLGRESRETSADRATLDGHLPSVSPGHSRRTSRRNPTRTAGPKRRVERLRPRYQCDQSQAHELE